MGWEGIGSSVARREGPEKLTGAAVYVADQRWPDGLFGATVRSRVARGRVRAIHYGPGVPWEEITVVTARDLEAMGWRNRVASIEPDQPFLVETEINHAEEPIVLLAHPDRHVLERARRAVTVEVEELEPVLDLDVALACVRPVGGRKNLFKEIHIEKGDPAGVWARAAQVVEGEYRTGAQEQLYIETNGMSARVEPGPEGPAVTVLGSLQCPYYVHTALCSLFGLPGPRVRVLQMATGGAFGGKEDYPSIIAGHAALLAWKAGRPVTLLYDREEDMACTTKRHPSRSRLRTAFDGSGHLLAMSSDFVLDAGAYTTLSPVVLSRGAIHALGPYRCPHVHIHARAVATNRPPNGAFRGFGAPQSLFAIERHMDIAAARMEMDPVELRRRNLLRPGDRMATGQRLAEDIDLPGLMDRALEDLGYRERLAAQARGNPGAPIRRGVGFSVFMHGCGFTGSGESHLASVTGVEARPDGRVAVLAASTEMGQGKETVFTQIVSEALGIPNDLVLVAQADTAVVPDSGPTVASRSTMVVGRLVQDAALALRQALVQGGYLAQAYTPGEFQGAVRAACARAGGMSCYAEYRPPPGLAWDDATYRGDAYPTYSWACYAVAVAVDTRTWEVKVEDFVARQEVGRVINPVLAAGQIEGGVAQGIGWALWEQVDTVQGRMANNQMTNYIVATALDLPRIRVFFEENNPFPMGPGGAKGLGELPMDGPAPAVLGAVQNALGLEGLRELPLTPERLLAAVEAAAAEGAEARP